MALGRDTSRRSAAREASPGRTRYIRDSGAIDQGQVAAVITTGCSSCVMRDKALFRTPMAFQKPHRLRPKALPCPAAVAGQAGNLLMPAYEPLGHQGKQEQVSLHSQLYLNRRTSP